MKDALGEFREMLRQDPNEKVALNSLAWLMATYPDAAIRNGPEAVKLAQKAVALEKGDQPVLLDTLAAAYAGGRTVQGGGRDGRKGPGGRPSPGRQATQRQHPGTP